MSLKQFETKVSTVPSDYARGFPIPWWSKVLAKLVLARIPLGYRTWSRLGLFRHGMMDTDLNRITKGWRGYAETYRDLAGRLPRHVMELGPGDSLGRALCAAADGVERMWFIDIGDFATKDMHHYKAIGTLLAENGTPFLDVDRINDRDQLLKRCHARYLTRGLASFSEVGDGEVEMIFSNSVLEHLPLEQFDTFLSEMFRVLSPGGVSMHRVDLQDHLGGRLEHLRFPSWFWENPLVARSGFYTNRLRYPDIVKRARCAGFETAIPSIKCWSVLPASRSALHEDFRGYSDRDLQVCGITIIMCKPESESVPNKSVGP